MPTLWVSTTGSDPGVKDDQGQPWATFAAAESAADPFDVILFEDGTHLLGGTTEGDIETANLTIGGVTDKGATIQADVGAARMFRVRANDCTFGQIIIDGTDEVPSAIEDASPGSNQLIFDGTHIKGHGSSSLVLIDAVESVELKGNWILERTGQVSTHILDFRSFNGLANNGGTLWMHDGTLINPFPAGASHDIYVRPRENPTGEPTGDVNVLIHDVAFQIDETSMLSGLRSMIRCEGASNVEAHSLDTSGCTFNEGRNTIINVNNSLSPCDSVWIHDMTLQMASDAVNASVECTGVQIGRNSSNPVEDDSISNVLVENVNVSGSNHAFLMGYITAPVVRQCHSDLAYLGIVLKGVTNGVVTGCIVERNVTSGFTDKAGSGNTFNACFAILSAGYVSGVPGFQMSPEGVDTQNAKFYNCNTYSTAAGGVAFSDICTTSSSADIRNCNFFNTGGFNANPYRWRDTPQSSLANFITALEGTGSTQADLTEVDPDFAELTNYTVANTSALWGAGYKYWGTGPRPPTFSGEPMPDTEIDVACSQSTTGPNHPSNL